MKLAGTAPQGQDGGGGGGGQAEYSPCSEAWGAAWRMPWG